MKLDLSPEVAAECLNACGITFLFAPLYHPAMKHAAAPRRELGIRTVFNLLGPLTNPAGVRRQVLGVFERRWVEPLARVLAALGVDHALVVSSLDGLDEISPSDSTQVCEVKNAEISLYHVQPEDLGEPRQPLASIRGGEANFNAELLAEVLAGTPHPASTAVSLNAGAALYVAGLAASLREGVAQARSALESRAARDKLGSWAAWTQSRASSP